MKKLDRKAKLLLVCCALVLISTIVLFIHINWNNTTDQSGPGTSASLSQSFFEDASSEIYKGTNVGMNTWGTLPEDSLELEKQFTNLELLETSITTSSGHKLYESQNGAGNYIVSGNLLFKYVGGDIIPTLYDFLREEETGRRIRIYDNQDDIDAAILRQADGKAILDGTAFIPYERAVVFNGSLLGSRYAIREDEELFVHLPDLANEYSYHSYYDPAVGVLLTYNQTGYFFPCQITSKDYTESLNVSQGRWDYRNTDSENIWSDTFNCIDSFGYIELETVSRILGWTYELKDGILLITSNQYDMYPLYACVPGPQFEGYDVYTPEEAESILAGRGEDTTGEVQQESVSEILTDTSENGGPAVSGQEE